MSSMGAPFTSMNATMTPSLGLLGSISIFRPAISEPTQRVRAFATPQTRLWPMAPRSS